MTSLPRSAAMLFLAATLALPAGGALAQTVAPGSAPGTNYDQNAPPSGNAAMTPLAAPKAKPKGGCLKYGAAGAVGGHLAHHHAVLGAMGGCAVGMYVKHRSKKNIRETGQP